MATFDEEQPAAVAGALNDLGAALRRQPSVRDDVMRRVTQHAATGVPAPRKAGMISRRSLGRIGALAACAAVALLVWSPWGGNGIGAQQAFAAAIANVERAHTFACRQIVSEPGEDGVARVRETIYMFREPNLERIEQRGNQPAQVTITDFDKQVQLVVQPDDKTGVLYDISTLYSTDDETGELKPTELGTHARDDVRRISAKAVKDLGLAKLNGREVWVLQSDNGAEPIATVYINPEDGNPVQVELASPSRQQVFAYTDIQVDVEIDDALFSLEPPAGYAMHRGQTEPMKPVDETNGKLMAKTMRIMRECMVYMNKHDGKWPAKLEDLQTTGLDAEALKTLLSAPDSDDGKPVFVYRQPKPGERDVVILYEAPDARRKAGIVCGFDDCHAEFVTHERFKELMKKQGDGN